MFDFLNMDIADMFRSYDAEADETANVLELWTVKDWLAYQLEQAGEKVVELGLLRIWCRATTGQAINLDSCMQEIYADYVRR